ncbi:MAG: hypothetical protein AAF830_08560 [Pseudomonadota bacterium]
MRRALTILALLGLVACSRGGVVEITNDTGCAFKDVSGYRVDPRTNERELVFRLYDIAPGETRPGFFDQTWNGDMEVTSERPPFYTDKVAIVKGEEKFSLAMSEGASAACLSGSPE